MNWIPAPLRQFVTYSLVGVLNTATDFLVYLLCISALSINLLAANSIAFAIAVTQGYLLNTRWTFRDTETRWSFRSYFFFVAINLGGLVISTVTIVLLSDWLGPLLAKLASVVFIVFWGFLMAKRFVFSGKTPDESTESLHDSRPTKLAS